MASCAVSVGLRQPQACLTCHREGKIPPQLPEVCSVVCGGGALLHILHSHCTAVKTELLLTYTNFLLACWSRPCASDSCTWLVNLDGSITIARRRTATPTHGVFGCNGQSYWTLGQPWSALVGRHCAVHIPLSGVCMNQQTLPGLPCQSLSD